MTKLFCYMDTKASITEVLQVVTVCVEDVVDPRDPQLQQAGCAFLLWVLEAAGEDVVAEVSQPILDGTIYALNLLAVAAPTPSPPIRRMLYKAVGQIAEVLPHFLVPDSRVNLKLLLHTQQLDCRMVGLLLCSPSFCSEWLQHATVGVGCAEGAASLQRGCDDCSWLLRKA